MIGNDKTTMAFQFLQAKETDHFKAICIFLCVCENVLVDHSHIYFFVPLSRVEFFTHWAQSMEQAT